MKLVKKAWDIIKQEDGWGSVEALILVAAFAIVALAVTVGLQDKLAGSSNDSAVNVINKKIGNLMDQVVTD